MSHIYKRYSIIYVYVYVRIGSGHVLIDLEKYDKKSDWRGGGLMLFIFYLTASYHHDAH